MKFPLLSVVVRVISLSLIENIRGLAQLSLMMISVFAIGGPAISETDPLITAIFPLVIANEAKQRMHRSAQMASRVICFMDHLTKWLV